MVDRFLQPPSGASDRRGSAREARILRDRQTAHEDALDRATNDAGAFGAARIIGQVYNGGAMPNTTPRVYLTHPVLISGPETEGGSPTLTVDTDASVPVVVLGKAPVAGDYLTAYAVGGRWVSEELTHSNTCCCCDWWCPGTAPSVITLLDPVFGSVQLTNSVCVAGCFESGGLSTYCRWTGSATIDYAPANGCGSVIGLKVCFSIGCDQIIAGVASYAFTINWNILYPGSGPITAASFCPAAGACPTPSFNGLLNSRKFYPLNCDYGEPWSQTISDTFDSTTDPSRYWNNLLYNLYRGNGAGPVDVTWNLAATTPGISCATTTLQINGCASGLSGATVNIYDHQGGTLIGTGITDALGRVNSSITGFGSVYVTVTEPSGRFAAFAGTVSLSCRAITPINLIPANGYVCCACPVLVAPGYDACGCQYPIATTLHATDSVLGTVALTYAGANPSTRLCVFRGTSTYAYPGNGFCPPTNVNLVWEFSPGVGLTILWCTDEIAGFACPNNGVCIDGTTTNDTLSGGPCGALISEWSGPDPGSLTSSCPPAFSFSQRLKVFQSQPPGNQCSPPQTLYNNSVAGAVMSLQTVTE
jgi:hypothetical protein